MKTDGRQALVLNIVVGIVGALAGGWLLSPLMGADTARQPALRAESSRLLQRRDDSARIVNLIRQIAAGGD